MGIPFSRGAVQDIYIYIYIYIQNARFFLPSLEKAREGKGEEVL